MYDFYTEGEGPFPKPGSREGQGKVQGPPGDPVEAAFKSGYLFDAKWTEDGELVVIEARPGTFSPGTYKVDADGLYRVE